MPDLGSLYRQVGLSTPTRSAGINHAYDAKPVAAAPAKQNFFAGLAKSAINLPVQAGLAVGHALVDPFIHLGQNAMNAVNAGRNAKEAQSASANVEKQLAAAKAAYGAGKLTKADYLKAIQASKQAYVGLSNTAQQNQVKSIPQMLPDAASAILTTATLGAGALAKGGAQAALKAAPGVAGKVGGAVGKAIDATIGSGQTLGKGVLPALAGKTVRAAVNQPIAQAPFQIQQDLQKGNIAGAAGNAVLLAAPSAISLAGKGVKALNLSERAFGKSAVLTDALGSRVADYLKANPQKAPILKMMEQFTLSQPSVGGDAKAAGQFLAQHFKSIGVDPKTAPMDQLVSQFTKYAKNVKAVEIAKQTGKAEANTVVSADFRDAVPAVVKKLQAVEGADAPTRAKVANDALDELGIQNQTVRDQIGAALLGGASAKELKPIVQKLVVPGVKLDKGFIATVGPSDRAAIPSLAEAKAMGAPELGTKPGAVLGSINTGLKKAGVGLNDYNPSQISDFRNNFSNIIQEQLPSRDPKAAMTALEELANEKKVSDLRQLTISEIADKLGVEKPEARVFRKALDDAFKGVNLADRGLANRLQDYNLKYNPLARGYSRIQSALRYTLNPAFKAQQVIESATLGRVASGGHLGTKDVQGIVNKMEGANLLPKSGTAFAGESLEGTKGMTNITTNLLPQEKRELAKTLSAIAEKSGTSIDDELKNESTRRILRAIVQTPKQGFLSSNFAKTMNLALFPLSYNIKVATIAGKALASQPKPTQFAVLKGISDFNHYLNTDEGIKWKAENDSMLKLVSYFTPINSIQQIYDGLSHGNPRSLGLIGGLPFGVVSRVLEGQGWISKSQPPFVDPQTGQIVPDKIPANEAGRVKQALSDILDTMFTYPGRQAGLGSKTDLLNTVTGNYLKGGKGEFNQLDRSNELTPQQKNVARVLSARTPQRPSSTPVPTSPAMAPPTVKPNLALTGITPRKLKSARPKTKAKRPGQPF